MNAQVVNVKSKVLVILNNPLRICGDTHTLCTHMINGCQANNSEGGLPALHTASDFQQVVAPSYCVR